jgi:hypothetical protein
MPRCSLISADKWCLTNGCLPRRGKVLTTIARRQAEGKSWAQALRCLKHRIARPLFRLFQARQFEAAQAA